MTRYLHIIDTTLRDGEHASGVRFNLEDKLKIATLLEQAQVKEVEIGAPAKGPKEQKEMGILVSHNFQFCTSVWCRPLYEDIDVAEEIGCHGVSISFPVSDVLIKAKGKTKAGILTELKQLLRYAQDRFHFVAIGAQDASRAELSFLFDFIEQAQIVGARRIRIADTVGILNPFSTMELIQNIRKYCPDIPLSFHGHNDLGMATANTIAAFKAGAYAADVTINGLGERAGNAPLEEVVMALDLSFRQPCGVKTELLKKMSTTVEAASGKKLAENKAVIGNTVIGPKAAHGSHSDGDGSTRNEYHIVEGKKIGMKERDFIFGKNSGRSAVAQFFQKKGIKVTETQCEWILEYVKQYAAIFKREIIDDELMRIYLFVTRNPQCFSK